MAISKGMPLQNALGTRDQVSVAPQRGRQRVCADGPLKPKLSSARHRNIALTDSSLLTRRIASANNRSRLNCVMRRHAFAGAANGIVSVTKIESSFESLMRSIAGPENTAWVMYATTWLAP